MPRFFISDSPHKGDEYTICGENASHIARSLRMREGELLTLCDGKCGDFLCEILTVGKDNVSLKILDITQNTAEPKVGITLFQALPKGDKFDLIVQKAVELGVEKIVPVLTERCIKRPEDRAMDKKLLRLNQISLEAAKQSGRGTVPRVGKLISFEAACNSLLENDLAYICYENERNNKLAETSARSIGIFIGPEGGFSTAEIEYARKLGVEPISLGPRILRTETAGVACLAVLMYIYGG